MFVLIVGHTCTGTGYVPTPNASYYKINPPNSAWRPHILTKNELKTSLKKTKSTG